MDPDGVPTIAPAGIDPTIVCLIGQGIGYHTYTETVSFASGNSVVLSKQGINTSSIVVKGFVADPGGSGLSVPKTFVADNPPTINDYTTTVNATGGVDFTVTTLVREPTGTVVLTYPQVTVTYNYTDSTYHSLQFFDDFDTFQQMYGPPYDVNGNIVSPLSLAGMVAMQNGANRLYAIALDNVGTIASQFNDAYNSISTNYAINIVVPLWSGVTDPAALSAQVQTFTAWLTSQANDGYLRMGILGFDKGYAPTVTALASFAQNTSNARLVFAWPNQLNLYNGTTNRTDVIDGFYLAAGYGGQLSALRPQDPLTRKALNSFSGMPTVMANTLTKSNKNQLSSAGVCVTELTRTGRLIIRHGLTTAFSAGILQREISLVRARDSLYLLVQESLNNANIVGTAITPNTALNVKGIVSGALESAKASGIVYDYNNLKVRQQSPPSGDPTIMEVKFAYRPSFPLNYVIVVFSVDTTTGATLPSNTSAVSDASTLDFAQG